jgi:ACT domain-containing protein
MARADHPVVADAARLVVRIWLPDRPGALGLVASRIGALGADIVGIDVLERSEHVAVDEFAVVLASDELVPLLVREIAEVDGASVEEWRLVENFPDPRLDALETVEQIAQAAEPTDLALRLANGVRCEFVADWSAVIRGGELLGAIGA